MQFKSELKLDDRSEEVKYLNNFLRDYFDGVIDLDNYVYESKDIFDEETEQNLKLFQKYHGLKISGILDNDTADLINNTTCMTMPPFVVDDDNDNTATANSSFVSSNHHHSDLNTNHPEKFSLVVNPAPQDRDEKRKWQNNTLFNKTDLTYGFLNFTDIIGWKNGQIVTLNPADNKKTLRFAMKHNADLINEQTQGKFTLTEVTSNSPDISISFSRSTYFLQDNKKYMNVLGITVPPKKDQQVKKANIQINAYRHYTTHSGLFTKRVSGETEDKGYLYASIFFVLLHETLHALGLAHTYKYPYAVMADKYETYEGWKKIRLADDDINGLNTIYAKIKNI